MPSSIRRFGGNAARRPAAGPLAGVLLCDGFLSANESACEFAFHFGRDAVHVDAFGRQKLPGVFYAVNARRLDFDFREPRGSELRAILGFLHRSRDAPYP